MYIIRNYKRFTFELSYNEETEYKILHISRAESSLQYIRVDMTF